VLCLTLGLNNPGYSGQIIWLPLLVKISVPVLFEEHNAHIFQMLLLGTLMEYEEQIISFVRALTGRVTPPVGFSSEDSYCWTDREYYGLQVPEAT
jgi:hypothetical protein